MKTFAVAALSVLALMVAVSAEAAPTGNKPIVGGCVTNTTCGGNPYRCVTCTTCCYGNQCNTNCY